MDLSPGHKLHDNLAAVEERIAKACARAGRKRSEVTLVAVTKSVAPEIAALLPELGVRDLGENRPQELWRKSELLTKDVHWHLIGHLQRNKIERTLPFVQRIHSVDSVKLLEALDQEAAKQGRTLDVLLEVNVSGEASKQGFSVSGLEEGIGVFRKLTQVRIDGLMTMAPLQDADACRPTFAGLRAARDFLRLRLGESHPLAHLSMGMSNDFEVAIEEGATLVRLGTILFEGVGA